MAGSFVLLLCVMVLGGHFMLMFPLVPSLVAAVLGVACLVSSALDYARSTRVELPAEPTIASASHGEDSSHEKATPKTGAVVGRHAA